jgi:protein-tyrosine phosphatase
MINAYAHLMSEPVCIRHFGKALRIVMENDYTDGCVLWHCSEGKDRCGLLSAFVLTVLGVDEDTIREDYLLTNEVNGPRAEYFYHMYRENGRSEADCIAVRDVFLAKEEYLNVALKTIIDGYGSMDNFITEGMGISQELIDSFRAQILE